MESPLWLAKRSQEEWVMLSVLMAEGSLAGPLWRLLLNRNPRGRPGHVSEEALLVGMYLSCWESRCVQMAEVDRRLQGLDPAVRDYLGVRAHDAPRVTNEGRRSKLDREGLPIGRRRRQESNVAEPLHRLSSKMAECITCSEFAGSGLTPQARAEKWSLQRLLLDRVMAGFLPEALPLPDMLTIDATGIRSFGDPPSGDADADWVYQTPTDRDPNEMIWGYNGSALSGRNLDTNFEYPSVTFNFALTGWADYGTRLHEVAYLLLDGFRRTHGSGLVVVTDSAYPYKKGYAREVRRLGFKPLHDNHPNDRGRRGNLAGFQTLGPEFYCPAFELEDHGSPVRDGLDLDLYNLARDEQLLYAAQVLAVEPDRLVVACPAQAPAPTVRCSRQPESLLLSRAGPPTITKPPTGPGPPCCSGPVVVDVTEHVLLEKAFQHAYTGSPEWRTWFTPGRTGGEGIFGLLFGENGQHALVGLTNWVEQVRTAWAYAVALAVQNVKLMRIWWFKPHVRERLSYDIRCSLQDEPLLWPLPQLREYYRKCFLS